MGNSCCGVRRFNRDQLDHSDKSLKQEDCKGLKDFIRNT